MKTKLSNSGNFKGLKYFIFKTNTLIIYREIVKYCGKIPNISSKNEMKRYIREELMREASQEYNEKTVEYKLGLARKQCNTLKQQIDMLL
jgi:hypothetical protein